MTDKTYTNLELAQYVEEHQGYIYFRSAEELFAHVTGTDFQWFICTDPEEEERLTSITEDDELTDIAEAKNLKGWTLMDFNTGHLLFLLYDMLSPEVRKDFNHKNLFATIKLCWQFASFKN